jgi:hypothetical protein
VLGNNHNDWTPLDVVIVHLDSMKSASSRNSLHYLHSSDAPARQKLKSVFGGDLFRQAPPAPWVETPAIN